MRKIAIATLIVLLLALMGCVNITMPQPQTPRVSSAPAPQGPIDANWKQPAFAGGGQLTDMVAVVNQVRPSVVAIDVEMPVTNIFGSGIQEGAGSGWIIDPNGLIVTNNHVVEGASTVQVTLSDGRILPARQINTDAFSDIAVIKIDATGLPAAKIGDSSKLQVGATVAAIGNALGQGIIMTGGWVSRLGASISVSQGQTLYDLIETDAAINPGNSGGPLANMAGEVVGITNAKLVSPDVSGIGFAISMRDALPVINALITTGTAVHPYFGVVLMTVNPAVASRYGLAVQSGALISQVSSGGPAAQAGLQANDVIVAINGTGVATASDAAAAVQQTRIGVPATVTYYRGSQKSDAQVVPAQRP